MKKSILLCCIALLTNFSSKAQFKKEGSEKIQTYKIAYLTEKLNLTEDEAQKFWPIYNKYDKKIKSLHREKHLIFKKKIHHNGGVDALSEKDAKEILERIQAIKKEQHEIKTVFHQKISKILSFKKVLSLQISEHDFNRKLIKKLRDKHKKRS
ncbi:sensor of ECF-type sigma factor [Tenacibaculum pacificus]|uniref:sensor of ECF-type sigma factor n=1 Tax=Tenacibaculum pacificus TaxID=3018314 RepID=UPI0022F3C178|nr:sensor of ECF-type sigma factor [Tenacibaculum pacificus]WBX74443.1 sensor of ECF-type sigma factor [Tenacibaculum pacificus]